MSYAIESIAKSIGARRIPYAENTPPYGQT